MLVIKFAFINLVSAWMIPDLLYWSTHWLSWADEKRAGTSIVLLTARGYFQFGVFITSSILLRNDPGMIFIHTTTFQILLWICGTTLDKSLLVGNVVLSVTMYLLLHQSDKMIDFVVLSGRFMGSQLSDFMTLIWDARPEHRANMEPVVDLGGHIAFPPPPIHVNVEPQAWLLPENHRQMPHPPIHVADHRNQVEADLVFPRPIPERRVDALLPYKRERAPFPFRGIHRGHSPNASKSFRRTNSRQRIIPKDAIVDHRDAFSQGAFRPRNFLEDEAHTQPFPDRTNNSDN